MPIAVSCPHCGTEYNVTDDAAGRKFRCKECEAVVDVPTSGSTADSRFDAGFPGPGTTFEEAGSGGSSAATVRVPRRRPAPPPAPGRNDALERLNGPSIGLMISAGIGIAGALFLAAMFAIAAIMGPPAGQQMGPAELIVGFGFWFGLLFMQFVASIVVMFGAMKMRKCESHGMALASAILAAVPCFTPCVCMPFGIWAIAVLSDYDVKQAFGEGPDSVT